MAELCDCDPARIERREVLEPIVLRATRASGATIVGYLFHQFAPCGVTGVVAISESHVSVHSWPEEGYLALDVFTCSARFDPAATIREIAAGVRARRTVVERLPRGPRRTGGRRTERASP